MATGHEPSFSSKAAHFVSDLTTVLFNPISDEPSKPHDMLNLNRSQQESISEEDSDITVGGPDTSSFTAFLYSLMSSSESGILSKVEEPNGYCAETDELTSVQVVKETSRRKSLLSRGKQSLGRAIYHAVRINGYRNQASEHKGDCKMKNDDENGTELIGLELRPMQTPTETVSEVSIPGMSESSLLLSEKYLEARDITFNPIQKKLALPWFQSADYLKHPIMLVGGHCLSVKFITVASHSFLESVGAGGLLDQVVGDQKGAIFGGLVEAPLRPTNKRKYQGTNNTFVFTNTSGHPVVFRPTGANRYFTLCSTDFLALGGGGHFALYLDGDLLSGSSSVSETFGNPCLAHTQDFEVKEVELWGFAYASKYEETVAFCRTEAPGICRW